MNPNRDYYGAITIGSQFIEVGKAKYLDIAQRMLRESLKHTGRADSIKFEFSTQPIKPTMTQDDELVAALRAMPGVEIEDASSVESDVPGVSVEELWAALESPEGQALKILCEPSKRVGVDQATIDSAKSAFALRYPLIAPYYPKWIQ